MSTAYVALLCSCGLILLASRRAVPGPARGSVAYWWVLFAFGYCGVIQVLDLRSQIGSGNTAAFVASGPAILLGVVLFGSSLARCGYLGTSGLALAGFGIFSLGFVLTRDADLMPVVAFLAILPAVSVRGDVSVAALRRGVVDSMALIAVALVWLAVVAPDVAFGRCRLDKCSLFGQQLGQLGGANAIGMIAATAGVIAAACLERRRLIFPYLAGVFGIVDLSSSRSALMPLAFGAAAVLAVRFFPGRWRSRTIGALALGAVGAQVYVATHTWAFMAFTARGVLWDRAQALIGQSPLWGYGPSFWVRQNGAGDIVANYSAHNLILELLVATGFLGFTLVCAAIVAAWRNRTGADRGILAVAVIAWLAGGITEVVAAPGRLYIFFAVFPFIFVLARAGAGQNAQAAEPELSGAASA